MRDTIQHIRDATKSGKLPPQFRATQVNEALGIYWAGNFMAKHCKSGESTELFVRISRGLYRLK